METDQIHAAWNQAHDPDLDYQAAFDLRYKNLQEMLFKIKKRAVPKNGAARHAFLIPAVRQNEIKNGAPMVVGDRLSIIMNDHITALKLKADEALFFAAEQANAAMQIAASAMQLFPEQKWVKPVHDMIYEAEGEIESALYDVEKVRPTYKSGFDVLKGQDAILTGTLNQIYETKDVYSEIRDAFETAMKTAPETAPDPLAKRLDDYLEIAYKLPEALQNSINAKLDLIEMSCQIIATQQLYKILCTPHRTKLIGSILEMAEHLLENVSLDHLQMHHERMELYRVREWGRPLPTPKIRYD